MGNLEKIQEDFIKKRFFEDDLEHEEDLTIGLGCFFFSLILLAALLVLFLIYKLEG